MPHSIASGSPQSACHAETARAMVNSPVRVPASADTDAPEPCGEATVHTAPSTLRPLPGKLPTLVGKCLGDYEILSELGRGGMGVVYKAHQKSLDRAVALKLLAMDALNDEGRAARFGQEARTVAALSHPNIVPVHQFGRCSAGQFLIMDFIEGESLDALARKGPLPAPWIAQVMQIVAEAIHYAHQKGVLHRDLKPANVLVEGGRRPVIIDFGLAKFLAAGSALTVEGTIMGSPSYMAPEQAGKDLDKVGPASDVYSLGAILYMLLTGQPPYDEGSFLSTVLSVVAPEMAPSVRSIRPEVPAEMERICMKCLSKDPKDRYPTAQALADDLRRFRSRRKRPDPSRTTARFPNVVFKVMHSGQEIRLNQLRQILGSDDNAAVVLRDEGVAPQHCQLLLKPGQAILDDLGSEAGTLVNGHAIRRAALRHGDVVKIGPYTFQVSMSE